MQHNQATLDAAFRLTLDVADVTQHPGWRAARDQALATLAAGPGLAALFGPAGTGKTLLLHELARSLRATGRPCHLIGRGDLPFTAGPGEIVLVDEAARIEAATLRRLCASGAAAIVAELPGFEDHLDSFAAAITVVRLAPLQPDEIGAFVADRLARAGQPSDVLTPGAIAALAMHSAGVPRVLNLLARAALFMAASEGTMRVEQRHVDLAIELREGGAPEVGALCSEPGSLAPVLVPVLVPLLVPVLVVDPVVTTAPEVMVPERPAAAPEYPVHSVPPSRRKIRAVRHGAVLLAATILLAAALVAGQSFGPHLVRTASTAPAPAAAAPLSASGQPSARSDIPNEAGTKPSSEVGAPAAATPSPLDDGPDR